MFGAIFSMTILLLNRVWMVYMCRVHSIYRSLTLHCNFVGHKRIVRSKIITFLNENIPLVGYHSTKKNVHEIKVPTDVSVMPN